MKNRSYSSLFLLLTLAAMIVLVQILPVSTYASGRKQASGAESMPGDCNGDGEITTDDAILILRMTLGLTEPDISAADFDGDGEITSIDALIVLRIALGIDDEPIFSPDPNEGPIL